ncbi:nitroreductase [Pyruvatibacter mobilis]|uniref:Nitroreductase n=1 Tax=Pyruvatibacter mobilis TaxID=1712261 RepID=A0A845QEQ9_9HYPH|nr:nitroreductase [Pyruvatibacter mobilis]NBG96788.1 nitroreductase [Pyruvatibacter mobilis]QJD74221.1 nitroreductase [Pyruvatibacter mobilis]GGD05113.1 nitroreductase [Pyruvatibacter mobilis]
MHVDDAIRERRSIRAFKSDPVPRALLEDLLEIASRAPSGTNVQPWHVHVVMDAARDRLVDRVMAHREAHRAGGAPDASSEYPRATKRKEPYVRRMRTLGKEMYGLLGIPKGDQEASWRQWGRNYEFFSAPVGLIFTIDKDLEYNSWLDIGIMLQTVMLAAKARGLDTCAQGAWNNFWTITKDELNIPDTEYIVCGMSLGYAKEDEPVNTLISEREPLSNFVTFHDG